ncbi:MAG: hypothetical protein M0020_03255 [Actinomycetota bacterium]|nr:hypothetical protein [Actinomycetota bacterium]
MISSQEGLVGLAAAVSCAAALRSTWSPCGLSILSTMTPLAERGRRHHFAATAAWFVAGALLGGASLGLVAVIAEIGASAVGLAPPAHGGATVAFAAAACAACAAWAFDLELFGLRLPIHRRQVNEDWLDLYRPWVYGSGFGWQIGSGLATYVMTAGTYLTVVLAALSGSRAAALSIGVVFGLVRGLAIFLGAGITSPARLVSFHRRLSSLAGPSRVAISIVEGAAAVAATGAAGGWSAGIAAAAVVFVVTVAARTRPSPARAPAPGAVVPGSSISARHSVTANSQARSHFHR